MKSYIQMHETKQIYSTVYHSMKQGFYLGEVQDLTGCGPGQPDMISLALERQQV